jgi:hypothetical protein
MRSRNLVGAVVSALVLAVVPATAGVGAATGSPHLVLEPAQVLRTYTFRGSGDYWTGFDSARDPHGRTTVAWRPNEGPIEVVTRWVDGTWSAVHALDEGLPGFGFRSEPQVGADADGRVTAVWSWSNGRDTRQMVLVASRSATGRWTAPVRISPAGVRARDPRLAVAADGTVAIAWASGWGRGPWKVWTVVKRPGRTWASVTASAPAALPRLSLLDVAASHAGKVVLAGMTGHAATINPHLVASVWRAGRGWSTARIISGHRKVAWFDLAVGPGGRALVGWQMDDARALAVRVMSMSDRWGPIVVFDRARPESVGTPMVSIDGRGVTRAFYERHDHLIMLSRRPDAGWHRRIIVRRNGGPPVDLAVRRDGTVALLWENWVGGGAANLYLKMRSPDGRWSGSRFLGNGFFGDNSDAVGTVVLVRAGRAVVTHPDDRLGRISGRSAYLGSAG